MLMLTAPNQRRNTGRVKSVTVTNRGNGYIPSLPTATFSAPPSGGVRATGVVEGPGIIRGATIINGGTGCTSPPTVRVTRTGGVNGSGAIFEAEVSGGAVSAVRVIDA